MVPIGDRFTMSPSTAALAVKRFFNSTPWLPCHYGSFPIIEATPDKFVAEDEGPRHQSHRAREGQAVHGVMHMSDKPKALLFDVFGTLVDWRTSIARESEQVLKPLGVTADWLVFADAWRGEYQGAMDQVRDGHIPFCKTRCAASAQSRAHHAAFQHFQASRRTRCKYLNLAWHRLDAWPDVPPGMSRLRRRHLLAPCSNGNISLMVDLARRNGIHWMRSSAPRLPATTSPSRASISPPARPSTLRPASA